MLEAFFETFLYSLLKIEQTFPELTNGAVKFVTFTAIEIL